MTTGGYSGDSWARAGFLAALQVRVTGSCAPEYRRPARAAERTRSRHARAGARRTRRHGLERRGPSGARHGWPFDAPFGPLTGVDLYSGQQIRRWASR